MQLVIIEAPGKLKKLRSLLPSVRPDVTWQVEATAGHIRDLPVHGQDPQMLTVGVGQDFKPHYQILSGKENRRTAEGAAAESQRGPAVLPAPAVRAADAARAPQRTGRPASKLYRQRSHGAGQ